MSSYKKVVLVFRHVPHEGLGTIAPVLAKQGLASRVIDTAHTPLRFPPLREVAGLIVMGGPMGVYEADRYPFLKKEMAYIKKAAARGIPVMGICLGSQLIAEALGGRVFPNKNKEIGWYQIQQTAAGRKDPFFKTASSPWVFQWHGDTFTLPTGSRRLASSPLCKNQAFRVGRSIYGLQFHLEVDRAMVLDWLSQPGVDAELALLGRDTKKKIVAGLPSRMPGLAKIAAPAFNYFASLCRIS